MRIQRLDHLVLTVMDMQRTQSFYTAHLGMRAASFGEGRHALVFGEQKINLHPVDAPYLPHAVLPIPGFADICLLVEEPVADLQRQLEASGVSVAEGPVQRTGACGPLLSIYLRDPDGNLIELSNQLD